MGKLLKEEKLVSISKKNLPMASLTDLNNPCENCYNTDFTPQRLDYLDLENVVVDMIRNYKDNQYQNIIAPGSVPAVLDDARSVHFSLNKLKSFIYDIENAICNRNSECKKVLGELGIRFYYAAYDQTVGSYAGKHTLVLVPTYTKDFKDGNPPQNVDFCPDWFKEGTCEPESLEQDGALYGSARMTQGAAQMRLSSSFKSNKKIMALVGGYNDVEIEQKENTKNKKVQNKSSKNTNEKTRRTPDMPDENDGGIIRTILNHGDLVPPPGKTPLDPPYRDAVLLNC